MVTILILAVTYTIGAVTWPKALGANDTRGANEVGVAVPVQELSDRLRRIEERLDSLLTVQAEEPRSHIQDPERESRLEQSLDRLERVLEAIRRSTVLREDLRVLSGLRERFPVPNQLAVQSFMRAVKNDPTMERTLWFSTMAEVIRRFGSPTKVIAQKENPQRWEYWDSNETCTMTVIFTDGVVTRVTN
jgi:hypothetical protein